MTTKQYLEYLERLEFKPCSKLTAKALGINERTCRRFANGERRITKRTELLLRAYSKLTKMQISEIIYA